MLRLRPAVASCLLGLAAALIALIVGDAPGGARTDPDTGGLIAFTIGESGAPRPSQLAVMAADGKHRRVLPPFDVDSGSWSPDGRSIVYGQRSGIHKPSIWTTNVGGGPARRIVRDGDSPDWSPDGRSIVFERSGDIWVFDPNTRRQRRIVRQGRSPRWSPDGGKLVFERGRAQPALWVVALAAKKERRLVRNGKFADWSPDGRKIVFERCPGTPPCFIYVVRADGTAERRLFEGGDPVWSPTGRQIAFLGADARRGYHDAITRARLDGSGRRVLFGQTPYCGCFLLGWSRHDGRRR